MGSGNSGNFFNPKNLIPTVLTGGLNYVAKAVGNSMKPPDPPKTPPPPDPAAFPHAFDATPAETMAQRQKKLAALQNGFASTMTNKVGTGSAPLLMPGAAALKTKTGQ